MRNTWVRELLLLFLLIAVPLCSYLNSLDGEFVFDDSRIYNSPAVRLETFSLHGLVNAVRGMEPATRPVANLTFVLNYLAHGFATRGYHLVNLVIHLATGLLFYFFLKMTLSLPVLQGRWKNPGILAFAAALLWLVHPLQTQAVSYIVQRMTSLAALFCILSLFLYARGRLAENADRRFLFLGGSILSWLLALGSKEIAVTLPLFILLYEWFFFQDLRRDWLRSNWKYLAVAGILLLLVPFLFFKGDVVSVITSGYAGRDFTVGQRVLTEFRVILYYLGLLAYPSPGRLSVEHDFSLSTSLFSPLTTLAAMVTVLVLLVLAVRMAPRFRLESFCILWFLGNHVVEGSVLPLELVFEHRNYLPSMSVVLLAVLFCNNLLARNSAKLILLCAAVTVASYWTVQRNLVWRSELSLWSDSVQKAPHLARVHNNLAVALKRAGRFEEATVHYRETIRLDPGFVEAYYNLANVMTLTGNLSEAVNYYRQAVLRNPGLVVLQLSLANALFDQGKYEEARHHYLQASRLDPGNVEARMNLERVSRMLDSLNKKGGS